MKVIYVFDIDGTLIDVDEVRQGNVNNVIYVLEKHKGKELAETVTKWMYEERHNISQIIEKLKQDLSEEVIQELRDCNDTAWFRYMNNAKIYEGFHELIEKIKERGHNIGILTIGNPIIQEDKLNFLREQIPLTNSIDKEDIMFAVPHGCFTRERNFKCFSTKEEALLEFSKRYDVVNYIGDKPSDVYSVINANSKTEKFIQAIRIRQGRYGKMELPPEYNLIKQYEHLKHFLNDFESEMI